MDSEDSDEQEVMEQDMDQEELQVSPETVKLDIFQHMRIGLKNKDINCCCDNELFNLYYCIPCKVSCCDKCFLMGKVLTELSALYSENEKRIIDRLSTSEGINKTNLPLNNKVEKLGPALEGMFVNDNKG